MIFSSASTDRFNYIIKEVLPHLHIYLVTSSSAKVIIYGSTAEGGANISSDIDLLIILNPLKETIERQVNNVILKSNKYKIQYDIMDMNNFRQLDPYYVQEVIYKGIVVYQHPLTLESNQTNLEPIALVKYSTKDLSPNERSNFSKTLHGYSTRREYKEKQYESISSGLLKELNGEKFGKGVVLIPSIHLNAFLQVCEQHQVKTKTYHFFRIPL